MGRRKKYHYRSLPTQLTVYAFDRGLDFHQYNEYHMRLMDGGFTVLDIWTTGRYYILTTDYLEMVGKGFVERSAEKGDIDPNDEKKFYQWLDKLFFPEEERIEK